MPDADDTGTLEFAAGMEPDAYVFDGAGQLGPSVSVAGDRLFAGDFDFPASGGGVPVPTAPGIGLASIRFAPSADAFGRFGVYALAGLANSEWTDAATPIQRRRTFANVPDAGGPVRIADVLVTSVADYDRDGDVGGGDFFVWQRTLGSTTELKADGDASGAVDAGDLAVWRENYGVIVVGATAASAASFVPVPEPLTGALLGVAGAVLFWIFRRGS